MPSTAGIVASGSAQLDQWLRAHLVAFDERRLSPLVNLGTLGAAGDATATGTRRLVNTETAAYVWVSGVSGNGLSTTALTMTGATSLQVDFDITPDALTTGAIKQLAGQLSGSPGNWGWQLYATTNTLGFFFSADGTATTGNPSCPYSTFGFGAGRIRGRVIWRANNGGGNWDVRWYTLAADGTPTLVRTNTGSGVSSIFNSTQAVEVGGRVGFVADNFPMVVHSVRISVDGVLQRGIDPSVLTDEGATSFTATTGQTVTINRSTGSGYQTSVVLPFSAKRLFNSNPDALTVAHSAGLNLGTGSFSVWWLGRRFATTLSNGILISKWDSAGSRGWLHMNHNATANTLSIVDDAPPLDIGAVAAGSFGTLALQGFTVDRSAGVVRSFFNDAEASVALGAQADFDTTADIRFGRFGTSESQPVEERAWGIYPGALTAAQWAAFRDALLVPERAAA